MTVADLMILLNAYQNLGFDDAPVFIEDDVAGSDGWIINTINSVRIRITDNDLKLENPTLILSTRKSKHQPGDIVTD